MTTFNFSNPRVFVVSVSPSAAAPAYTESGVQFTLSISNGDGANFAGVGGGSISLANSLSGGPTVDIVTLDPVGTGQTKFTGNISINVASELGSWAANGVALASGNNVIASGPGGVGAIIFTHGAGAQKLKIDSITATINCFLAGTRIATPEGTVAVEDLRPGMRIRTADGRETAVKWVGTQEVDTRLRHPAKVNPIRITAGALGGGLPERDLLISPDHAIAIDGMLINAGALVNGSTIYQEPKMPMDGFTYYHVETEAHELLLAEGVAAETFIDYAGRDSFENGVDSTAHIAEMDLPRISSARLVPQHIRAALTPAIAAE